VLGVLVAIIVLAGFELLVWRYGADSRDGTDWVMPNPCRESPRV
jgi:hypothetical protein